MKTWKDIEKALAKVVDHDQVCNWPKYKKISGMTDKQHLKHCPYEELKSRLKQTISQVVEECLNKAVEKRFPRGERKWCAECAKRIKKYVKELNKLEID